MRTHRRRAGPVAWKPSAGTLYRRRRSGEDAGMKPSSFKWMVVLLTALSFVPLASSARAADGPVAAPKSATPAKPATKTPAAEVTLKGQLTCAKCGLHESSVCQNVLRVPDAGGKTETKYYLAKNDVAQAHHEEVCGSQISATVTGRVSEEGGKKILTASAITAN